jgi:hypothetical protein
LGVSSQNKAFKPNCRAKSMFWSKHERKERLGIETTCPDKNYLESIKDDSFFIHS